MSEAFSGGSRPPLHGLPLAVAAVRSAIAYVVVSLYVLLVGPPALAVAFLRRGPTLLYVLGHAGVALALALVGIRARVHGAERLPGRTAYVCCSNHESNVDPPVLFHYLNPRFRIVFKAEMRKLPVLGPAMVFAGYVPVDRANPEQAYGALDQGAATLRAGHSFLIFPEGTRSRTGSLLPFKKGGFIMAIKAQVPILPVAVHGSRAAMAKGSAIIRPVTVTVRIGEPVETRGLTIEDRDRVIAEVRQQIEQMRAEVIAVPQS